MANRFFGGEQTPTGRMACDVATELVGLGHEVTILTSNGNYAGVSASPLPNRSAIRLRSLPQLGKKRIVNWGTFWLQTLLCMPLMTWDRCVLLTDPPFLPMAACLARMVRRRNRKIYWWTMDLYPEALVAARILAEQGVCYGGLRFLNELGLRALDGIIVLGPRQLRRLESYRNYRDSRDFALVVTPWDLREFPRIPAEGNRLVSRFGWQERKIALYAGNLGEGHLFEEFLSAARWFIERGRKEWLFVFAIRGARKKALIEQAKVLPNVQIMDYLVESETSHLLWLATVHLISMGPGWEGVIVPSKLYGALRTASPVLFVGPSDADTALELQRTGRGLTVPCGSNGASIAMALEDLSDRRWLVQSHADTTNPKRVAEFVVR